jgi:hypothetical protein
VNERLTFNHGVAVGLGLGPSRDVAGAIPFAGAIPLAAALPPAHPTPLAFPVVRPDFAYRGAWLFTALLFLRPQDTFPVLDPLHLSEVTAIADLLAMAVGRLAAGQPIVKVTPEIAGARLAVVMLATHRFRMARRSVQRVPRRA